MRKTFICLVVFISFLIISTAAAEKYSFDGPKISLELQDGTYETVLTKDNLAANEAFIMSKGSNSDALSVIFDNEGILLQAWDADKNRCLVLTALKDSDAQQYFDINKQDEPTRRAYRLSHSKGTAYGILGYSYKSAVWKNLPDLGRFLMLKYNLKTNGVINQRGYQRRTIRNGYTITMDMQVFDRPLDNADNISLNAAMSGLRFTDILPMPELPVQFTVSSAPPQETNSATFAMLGKATPGASISAVAMSLSSTKANLFQTAAKRNGSFTLPFELPAEGIYYITVSIEAQGALSRTAEYTVTYDKTLLPVNLTSTVPETLSDDTVTITGESIKGAFAQLVVNNKNYSKKIGTSKLFSFTVDTGLEGDYSFELTISKPGLETRSYRYLATRIYTDAQRKQKIIDSSISPSYSKLSKNIDTYDGRILRYDAYITQIKEAAGEWVVFMALEKNGDEYTSLIAVICNTTPDYPIGTRLVVYGTLDDRYYTYVEGGNDLVYPRLNLLFFDEPA